MSNLRTLLLCTLSALIPAVALAQAGPAPLPPSQPISDIDRLMRERDTSKRFFSDSMATLNLTYNSSGDLTSSLVKTEAHSLFMTVEVNGAKIKSIAKTAKPKVQEAVEAGLLDVKARWARPGTRVTTKCEGELTVGFLQIVFLPYGGIDRFSCHVELRNLPEEIYEEWQGAFAPEQTDAYKGCASQHPRGSAEFWTCIEGAGIPFPQA